ncbi:hypothetical protein HAX54_036756, partial [Datura stramonium]|nr:hypothetical protein [Datura stramonium]
NRTNRHSKCTVLSYYGLWDRLPAPGPKGLKSMKRTYGWFKYGCYAEENPSYVPVGSITKSPKF